jgi:undecaprenyl-diphosphatase
MNQIIFDLLFSLTHRYDWFDTFVVFAARDLPRLLVVLLLALAAVYYRRSPVLQAALFSAAAALFAWAGSRLIKLLYLSERPFVNLPEGTTLLTYASPEAFPSGHASFFFALAIGLYFYYPRLGVGCILTALLIGFARIATGLHWPIDIVGGFFLALIVALILRYLVLRNRNSRTLV